MYTIINYPALAIGRRYFDHIGKNLNDKFYCIFWTSQMVISVKALMISPKLYQYHQSYCFGDITTQKLLYIFYYFLYISVNNFSDIIKVMMISLVFQWCTCPWKLHLCLVNFLEYLYGLDTKLKWIL